MDTPPEPQFISVAEFREAGFLQELNRCFLHPHGLALSVEIDEETGEESFGPIWDSRMDPEGLLFADVQNTLDGAKAQRVREEYVRHLETRCELLGGSSIQGIGQEPPSA
jgi:hypothetical protein